MKFMTVTVLVLAMVIATPMSGAGTIETIDELRSAVESCRATIAGIKIDDLAKAENGLHLIKQRDRVLEIAALTTTQIDQLRDTRSLTDFYRTAITLQLLSGYLRVFVDDLSEVARANEGKPEPIALALTAAAPFKSLYSVRVRFDDVALGQMEAADRLFEVCCDCPAK